MEHLYEKCQYFLGNFQLEEGFLGSDKMEMSDLKEIRQRFILETKYLESGNEGVASFTWRGDIFLLSFSCPLSSLSTFNVLLLGSKEQSRGWRVRLEVLGPGRESTRRSSTAFEGPPVSIRQMTKRRALAGVTVGKEMIVKTSSGKAFFELDLTFKRLGGAF